MSPRNKKRSLKKENKESKISNQWKANHQFKVRKDNPLSKANKTTSKMPANHNKIWVDLDKSPNNHKKNNLPKTPKINWPLKTKSSLQQSPTLPPMKKPIKASICTTEDDNMPLNAPFKCDTLNSSRKSLINNVKTNLTSNLQDKEREKNQK
jgi:hypothetical protein